MRRYPLILILLFTSIISAAQKASTFTVRLPHIAQGTLVPISIDLDKITSVSEELLSLEEIVENKVIPIPFQVSKNGNRHLNFLITTENKGQRSRRFRLSHERPAKSGEIKADDTDGALTIRSGNLNLLRYQYTTIYPPHGIDTNYKRSGFIHPLWTPHGQELTRIQPNDHYHHYGIWNPWTHTLFESDTVDFWNIGDKKGTVRFVKFTSKVNGSVFAEFEALHEHVVFKKDGSEKIALNEEQTVRVYNPGSNLDYYVVDITSKMSCASQSPLLLLTYRYGGLGWRTTEFWDKDNCEVLTSEGKTRKNTDGSRARWCIVQGNLNRDFGGAVLLSHPGNYNHPEPLRIWDENANNNRGDMFANFSPTKNKDWLLEPGKSYTLRYRLVVFNGKFDATKAETAWQYFAKPPEVVSGE
jgi:Methane oxygenase PmoA